KIESVEGGFLLQVGIQEGKTNGGRLGLQAISFRITFRHSWYRPSGCDAGRYSSPAGRPPGAGERPDAWHPGHQRGGPNALGTRSGYCSGLLEMTPPVEWHLDTKHIGRRVLLFECVDSTNSRAAALAEGRANDGAVVLAEEQTAGRGQHGRT